jgi:hypothetical protein
MEITNSRRALMLGRNQKLFLVPAPLGRMPADLEQQWQASFENYYSSPEEGEAEIKRREETDGWGSGSA